LGQSVSPVGGAQPDGGRDLADAGLLDRDTLVRVHLHEARDALHLVAAKGSRPGRDLQRAEVDALREVAVAVRERLERQRGERLVEVELADDGLAVFGSLCR
jgi:hypothetical protein